MGSPPLIDDPIAALASAPGSAPRGVVRVSGDGCIPALQSLFTPNNLGLWSARRAQSGDGRLTLSAFRTPVPARLFYWPTHRSYTGQPLAEIHTIGSPPVLEALLVDLFRRGVRPAQPGEFTLRAFLTGRIDLTQAEAVVGVIDADGRAELESALDQLAGGLSRPLRTIRDDLMNLLADLEAGLDFVDEDIEFVSPASAAARIASAGDALAALLDQAFRRAQTSGRRVVVLAGLPNAGKSTLFNALAGREAALVSPVAGTTRDWLRAEAHWNGMAVELIDTAGWERTAEVLAAAGQTQRQSQLDRADLVVWCTAADLGPDDVGVDA